DDDYHDLMQEIGPLYKKRLEQMNSVENIALKAGWLDKCTDTIVHKNIDSFSLQTEHSAASWKGIVAEERRRILEEKKKNISIKKKNIHQQQNAKAQVQIVNYAYLQKLFHPKSKKDTDLIETISSKFSLNKEQERAFRIITQHVISNT